MKGLKPRIDVNKDTTKQSEPYAEPKFMLPPDAVNLPPPF